MNKRRQLPTTQALREQHSEFAEELGTLAACLASLDSGHAHLRARAMSGVQRFLDFMRERLDEHCADEDVLSSLFSDVVAPGVKSVRGPLDQDRSRLPFALQDLSDAARAALRREDGAEARVVSLGYAFGQALHCHICREERTLLNIVDGELGTGVPVNADAQQSACRGKRC